MKFFVWIVVSLLLFFGLPAEKSFAFDVNAGPIWSQSDARSKCPATCRGAGATWNGNWKTTIPGRMSVCGCASQGMPKCTTATVHRSNSGQSSDALAKAHCSAQGSNWHTFKTAGADYLYVTCCTKPPSATAGISAEFLRLTNAVNNDPALFARFKSATTNQQLVTLANQLGYRITIQDVTTAKGSNYYHQGTRKRHMQTRSVSGSCGGLRQPPCSVCTNSVTLYVPFNFCCIPDGTSCASYQSRCNNGFWGNRFGECWPLTWKTKAVAGWGKNFDIQWHLPMDWSKLNNVTELKRGVKLPTDGLFIFVYRTTDNRLLIRRSDRPDDKGCYAAGNKRYSYTGNPAGNGESPHMFVRHTQLNGGWSDVWSAGQLEIHGGKIIWISNQSGHFHPLTKSLDYAVDTLEAWGLAAKDSVHRFDFSDKHETPAACVRAKAGQPGLNRDEL